MRSSGSRQNRLLRLLLAAAAALLLVAVTAGALAAASRQQTADARDRQRAAAVAADARRLAAASLNEEQLDLALLQAVEAVRTEPGPETHGALLSLLARTPDLLHQRRAETPYLRADASADGRRGRASRSTTRGWSGSTPRRARRGGRARSPATATCSRIHGARRGFLVTYWDDAGGSGVQLWDDESGRTRWIHDPRRPVGPAPRRRRRLLDGVWLADGRVVVLTPTHLVTASPSGRPLRAVALERRGLPGTAPRMARRSGQLRSPARRRPRPRPGPSGPRSARSRSPCPASRPTAAWSSRPTARGPTGCVSGCATPGPSSPTAPT